jgi:hypothetical protein
LVAQAALIAWILISMSLFALMKPLRAFVLTYVIGILFLPVAVGHGDAVEGAIVFSQSVRIEKVVACNLGVLFGTLLFAPQVLRRYRFHWMDVALVGVALGQIMTSMVNGLGPKDGISVAFGMIRDYVPLVIFARLYLTSVNDVYVAMRAIVGGAFIYSAICVLEWRLSPQFHRWVYGYAQHDFIQHMREGHFRAMGFLRHGIEVSTFMGGGLAMAVWLWYKKLFKPLWGMVPVEVVIGAVAIGLFATMTLSGITESLVAIGLLGVFLLTRSKWVFVVLPIVAIVYMSARYTEALSEGRILSTVSMVVPEPRLESLKYRLTSEEYNLRGMNHDLLFGRSPQFAVYQDQYGRMWAVDAWWLIQITFFGLYCVALWYLIWGSNIIMLLSRWRRLTPDLQTLGALVALLVGVQFIDFLFNSFPSMFLMILNAGMVSAVQRYVPVKRRVMVQGPQAGALGPQSSEVALP